MNFTESPFCAERKFCVACRDRKGGAEWRKAMGAGFELPDGQTDFECPYGIQWGYDGSFLLGEAVARVAQPVAKAVDAVIGTNLQGCEPCKNRRKKLNQMSK